MLDVAVSRLWKKQRCRVFAHERSGEVYGYGGVKHQTEMVWTRAEAVAYRRLRMGHSLELMAYRARIGLQEEAVCRRCGVEVEDVEHVMLRCGAGELRRRALGGIGRLADLCQWPLRCARYWSWFKAVAQA